MALAGVMDEVCAIGGGSSQRDRYQVAGRAESDHSCAIPVRFM